MTASPSTCWTVIEGAAAGRVTDREEFARRYGPVVRACLAARWRPADAHTLDDAVQEVFVECFKRGGVLDRAGRDRGGLPRRPLSWPRRRRPPPAGWPPTAAAG